MTGSDIFNAAKELRIKLRGGGVRTGSLTPWQLRRLGLQNLADELSQAAGRPVHFMIYQSSEAAVARSQSIGAATESEISAARAAAPPEGAPSTGADSGPSASNPGADTGGDASTGRAGLRAGDVLGAVGWILLYIDAQKHGGIFSPAGLPGHRSGSLHLSGCARVDPAWVGLIGDAKGRPLRYIRKAVATTKEVTSVVSDLINRMEKTAMFEVYETYGFRESDIEDACSAVSHALDIGFERHQSYYLGEYFLADGLSGQKLTIESNELEDEDGLFFQHKEFSEYKTIVRLQYKAPPQADNQPSPGELSHKLERLEGLVLLERHFTDVDK